MIKNDKYSRLPFLKFKQFNEKTNFKYKRINDNKDLRWNEDLKEEKIRLNG